MWLDTEQPNSNFKKSAELFRQIKVIRYDSVIFFYADLWENCVAFLSDKKGLIIFQNSSLSKMFFISKGSKYFLLSIFYNLLTLSSLRLVWVSVLRYFVSSWDLCIIAFLKVFVMYGAWLALRNFFLNGACFFGTSMKVVQMIHS